MGRVRAAVQRRILGPLGSFLQSQSAGGVLLFLAAAVALIWANSPAESLYVQALRSPLLGGWNLHRAVNDGLMSLFFLLVGLEIKRELVGGELADRKTAALPVVAALGGMLVPALVFFAFNAGRATAVGWGVPVATDIAFSLAVMSLLGARVPLGLKVFLTALAIADDIGAVVVIAVFYSRGLHATALLGALACAAALVALNALRVRSLAPYLAVGAALWAFLVGSGVHPTVAGVVLALAVPHKGGDEGSPLQRLEGALNAPVNFAVMPLFALANAGVAFFAAKDALGPVTLGVAAGLVGGKAVGIALFSFLAVRSGLAALPKGVGWGHVAGAGLLGGIGFTMSLFIAGMAFPLEPLSSAAKVGILAGSALSGLLGAAALWLAGRRAGPGSVEPA